MKKAIRFLPFAMAALLVLGGWTTQRMSLTAHQASFESARLNEYAKKNAPLISVSYLDNGIPLIVKKSDANRILSVKAVLVGHVADLDTPKAGVESMMLTMMERGSARYPYEEVQRILFERSASIGGSYGSFDMSSFDMTTIDTYFDEIFDLYADAFLHPSWNAEEFPRVLNDFRQNRQEAENDPYQRAVLVLHDELFSGHPYERSWAGTPDSLATLTLDDVKEHYRRTVSASRLFLVAVGDFDGDRLVARLNASFGKLPAAAYEPVAVPSFEGKVKTDLIVEPYEGSEGLAYVRGDFALPAPDHPDAAAVSVAFSILDDVLFEIVRTRNGAAYSAWASALGFKANYGCITVYRTSVPGKVKKYVDDSIAVLLSGRCLSGKVSASAEGKSGQGEAAASADRDRGFVPIAEALPFYKRQFITSFFSGQQTNSSVASQIASSAVYRGDCRDYLLLADRVNAVTPEDVVRVTGKYLRENPILWVVLGAPEVLKDVKREDFLSFQGK